MSRVGRPPALFISSDKISSSRTPTFINQSAEIDCLVSHQLPRSHSIPCPSLQMAVREFAGFYRGCHLSLAGDQSYPQETGPG